MEVSKRNQHLHEERDHDSVDHEHRPYWKRMHRDWRAWFGATVCLAALALYVMRYQAVFFSR